MQMGENVLAPGFYSENGLTERMTEGAGDGCTGKISNLHLTQLRSSRHVGAVSESQKRTHPSGAQSDMPDLLLKELHEGGESATAPKALPKEWKNWPCRSPCPLNRAPPGGGVEMSRKPPPS